MRRSCHHIQTIQLICFVNPLTGFFMMASLTFNELIFSVLFFVKQTNTINVWFEMFQ